MESTIPEYALTGHVRGRTGTVLPFVAPSNIYPTQDEDYVLIAGNADTVFGRLAKAVGHPEWAEDERFATHHARGENMEELDAMISNWTRERSVEEVIEVLAGAGVPTGKVFTAEDMLEDQHYAARENIVAVRGPGDRSVPMQNVVPRLTETPGEVRWTGPALGQHNDEVYGGIARLGEAERGRLREKGIV
jgi:crotonobetainyl-CoA:carnitine CoA-transferase CaiB-like acyl-CoA transferase